MRLQYVYVAVLAVFALVASVNASSVGTEPKMANPNAHLDRALTEGLSDLGTKRLLSAGESNEDEERGAIANFFAKLSKLGKRKKIDPNKLPKVDLKKSPKVDPKVIAKSDSNVVTRAESKVLARVDSKVTTNAVPTVPKAVRAMPKEGTNLIKKLNGFVKEKKSLDDVFSSQVDGKQKLFDADGLPMYVRFSEKTAELRGGKDIYGVEKLVAKFDVEDLMKIINAGLKRDNELAVATADRVRAGLVSKSWREKMQPRDVAQLLKGGKVVMDRIHQGVYKKYLDAFNKANIAKPTA